MAIKTVSYAASDIGKHRSSNQDSGYAGYQLFFVADGMGGHAGGDIASAITSQRVAPKATNLLVSGANRRRSTCVALSWPESTQCCITVQAPSSRHPSRTR